MPTEEIEITELAEFEPTRVDGVGKAATGFPILMLKSIDGEVIEEETTIEEVLTDLDKSETTEDEREHCDACEGGIVKSESTDQPCGKCFGTGLLPKLGETPDELIAAAKASAPSGAPVPVRDKCPTCKGTGCQLDGSGAPISGKNCFDCDGSGKDSTEPPSDKLARVDADGHKIHEGDAKNREAVDKSTDDPDLYDEDETDLEKSKLKTKARNALPDSAFALPGRRYPIHDISHARNALARVAQNGTSDEKAKVRAAVHSRYPEIESDTAKGQLDGSVYSAANPALTADVAQGTDPAAGPDGTAKGDESTPGSPAWEANDAQIATDAATALMAAAELIRTFAQRENQEVAAGEGNDVFDVYDASSALCAVNDALGVMARLAFHEGLAAAKSLEIDEDVEKAGKRLSRKSVQSLADLRDHITTLLGDDDPTTTTDNDDGAEKSVEIDYTKLSEEIENMTTDELTKVLDAHDEKLVGILAEAIKGGVNPVQDVNHSQSIANAKANNSKGKNRKKKVAGTDDVLEDEASQGTNDSASSPAKGAAKSEGDEVTPDGDEIEEGADEVVAEKAADEELTPEEIEANEAAKAAKKEAKRLRKAAEQAAEDAAMRKAIEEATSEVRKANEALQERLSQVEKMAAPSTIVRTAPADAQIAAKARDDREMAINALERKARESSDPDVKKAAREELRELRGAPVAS